MIKTARWVRSRAGAVTSSVATPITDLQSTSISPDGPNNSSRTYKLAVKTPQNLINFSSLLNNTTASTLTRKQPHCYPKHPAVPISIKTALRKSSSRGKITTTCVLRLRRGMIIKIICRGARIGRCPDIMKNTQPM